MTDLRLSVDLVDFELMHVTVVMHVLDKRDEDNDAIYDSQSQPNERQQTNFSNFWEVDGGIRMTLSEANAFIKALSLSSGIEITTPFRERKNKEKLKGQVSQQNNEPLQAANGPAKLPEITPTSMAASMPAAPAPTITSTPAAAPSQAVTSAPAAATATSQAAPTVTATPAFNVATSAPPHFNQAAAAAPREETARGIAERFSATTAK